MRITYYRHPSSQEDDVVVSISHAKQMLKRFGGTAYTLHIERDGTVFEVSEVRLAGNNSHFKYNHHL